MFLILQILSLIIIVYISSILIYSMIKGAPYAPIRKRDLDTMLRLLESKKGEKLADLGSGDGRILMAAIKKGLDAYGYEINPILYLISKLRQKGKGKVYLKNYWNADLSSYNYITIYGVTFIMSDLEKKLMKELKPGTKVVTCHFKFPNWKPEKKLDNLYLYVAKYSKNY